MFALTKAYEIYSGLITYNVTLEEYFRVIKKIIAGRKNLINF
jgi:hypothetical protein